MKLGSYLILLISILLFVSCQKNKLGIFEAAQDIGSVKVPGSVVYDSYDKSYKITGSGENMWFKKDAFFYVWKKVSGDFTMSTEIEWVGEGVNPHRKGGIIIRQNLDAGSPYADAVVHGDGLTSLQYRVAENDTTQEIRAEVTAPSKIKLVKIGDVITMSTASGDGNFTKVSESLNLKMNEPYYIGLGVCSHETDLAETAIFKNVVFESMKTKADK